MACCAGVCSPASVNKKLEDQSAAIQQIQKVQVDTNNNLNSMWAVKLQQMQDGRLYIAGIGAGILFNNEVISYSLSERPVMNMVENMLDQAFKKLNPHEHPVLHSDQGWQYRMRRYQNILKEHGIKQSMSRKGNCLDNAVVECFPHRP